MPFRFGVVGAGRMGRNHIKAIANSTLGKVVAVSDPSDEARRIVDGGGINVYSNVESMLAGSRIDGVIVCVPTTLHLATLREVIERHMPVLAEKPLGRSADEAETIALLAQHAGVPLQVGFWRRFVPLLAKLRTRIRRGEFGDIYSVCCFQWDGAPPQPDFRRNSGGIVADMGVHDFEQVRWLTGQEFENVMALSADQAVEPWPNDPECVGVLAKLSEGATAFVSLGRRHQLGDVCKVEVFGTKGAEECRFLWPPTAEATFFDALGRQADSFISHVGGGALEGASGYDAVAALTIADRASSSLRLAGEATSTQPPKQIR